METLIKVVRSAGNLISSNLAPLVSALLDATQTAEGQSLNYLSVRLGSQHATQEKLDVARIAAAKSSNLFETVQHVIHHMFIHSQDVRRGLIKTPSLIGRLLVSANTKRNLKRIKKKKKRSCPESSGS